VSGALDAASNDKAAVSSLANRKRLLVGRTAESPLPEESAALVRPDDVDVSALTWNRGRE
jgi:hypothetical protein